MLRIFTALLCLFLLAVSNGISLAQTRSPPIPVPRAPPPVEEPGEEAPPAAPAEEPPALREETLPEEPPPSEEAPSAEEPESPPIAMPVVLVAPGEAVIALSRALVPLETVPGLAEVLEEAGESEEGPALALALQAEGEAPLERLVVSAGNVALRALVVETPAGPLSVEPIATGSGRPAFPVLVAPDAPSRMALRLDAGHRAATLHLWEEDAWRAYEARLAFLAGLFEGALFLLGVLLLARALLAAAPAGFAAAGLALSGFLVVGVASGTIGPSAFEAPRFAAGLFEGVLGLLALTIVIWAFAARPGIPATRLQLLVGLGLGVFSSLAALSSLVGLKLSAVALAAALAFAAALFWRAVIKGRRAAWWMAPGLFVGLAAGTLALLGDTFPDLLPLFSARTVILSLVMSAIVLAGLVALAPIPRALSESVKPKEVPLMPRPAPGIGAAETATRLEEAVRAAHEGLWEWSIEADELHVSPDVEAHLGEPPGAFTGSAAIWASRLHPEDIEVFRSALAAHLEDPHTPFALEFRMVHADGSHRWMHLRAQGVAGANGRIERCIGLIADVTGRKTALERRDGDALHDALTGLPNRALFLDRLATALAERVSASNHAGLTLFILDVDRFGLVLDSFGMGPGEELLIGLARRLEGFLQPTDTVARLGGDSFAILLRQAIPRARAQELAGAMQDLIAKPFTLDGREVFVSVSIGIALADEKVRSPTELLHEAQTALFDAKRAGPGTARLYSPAIRRARSERLALETDLRRALEREQIELVYQPIMSLADGRVAGFEGLLRWRHPARGLLTPKDFIGLAEETGLITELGAFALRSAAEQLAKWQTYFPLERPLFVSVNVSSRQFLAEDFIEAVGKILRSQTLAKNTVKLEVTESLIMEDPERSASLLARLTTEGAGLALDDFGTGFSSLSYLQRFPFDTLKIDRSFISMMGSDTDAALIVRSIVSLAQAMKLEVVAEGAESEEDAQRLKELGCEYAQGYLYSAPLSAAEADAFIARHWQD